MTVPAAWRAIAVVVLAAASVRSTADVSTYCSSEPFPEARRYCPSCLQLVTCDGTGAAVGSPVVCPYPQVCEETQTSASCVEVGLLSQCRCNSNQCDSYNIDYVDLCDSNGLYDVLECSAAQETCDSLGCGADAHTCNHAQNPGFNFSSPDCTKATYCREDDFQVLIKCESNEYVDDAGNCLPAPPEPCASGCTGLCPDNVNCSLYYDCDAASTPTAVLSCPADQYFNPNSEACETDSSVCARLTFCNFDGSSGRETATLTTTVVPLSCSSKSTGNTAAGPCSSSYWSCRNVGGGNYQSVPMECSDGLVFNTDPAYPYCTDPENVDTCDN